MKGFGECSSLSILTEKNVIPSYIHTFTHMLAASRNIMHFYSNRLAISACSVAPDDVYS